MSVLDDIRDGKGLKPITFNCFTCQNDNCIASGSKTATYQCPGYKHKKTNADRIRSMTDEEMAEWMAKYCERKTVFCPNFGAHDCQASCKQCWLDWLKEVTE